MKRDELAKWVLEVHGVKPPARLEHPDATADALGHDGLWWAVVNTESPEWEAPDSVWPDQEKAEQRASYLNSGRYPSWDAMPAVTALWMRNEFPPE